MKFFECLPSSVSAYVGSIGGVRELRLRNNHPIKINVGGQWFWVGDGKLMSSPKGAIAFGEICNDFVERACNSSVFAYEKMLAKGYFSLSDGTRVGVCGVMGNGDIFREYTSLCVRTARYFACVANEFAQSVVVAGPPASGKTTYLRALACNLSATHNVVVVDERGEISSCAGFAERSQCDVLKFATKRYAFEVAVRSLSPDWIVCDELLEEELPLALEAMASGVKVAASVHATNFEDLSLRLGKYLSRFGHAVLLDRFNNQTVVDLRQNTEQL